MYFVNEWVAHNGVAATKDKSFRRKKLTDWHTSTNGNHFRQLAVTHEIVEWKGGGVDANVLIGSGRVPDSSPTVVIGREVWPHLKRKRLLQFNDTEISVHTHVCACVRFLVWLKTMTVQTSKRHHVRALIGTFLILSSLLCYIFTRHNHIFVWLTVTKPTSYSGRSRIIFGTENRNNPQIFLIEAKDPSLTNNFLLSCTIQAFKCHRQCVSIISSGTESNCWEKHH